MARLTQDEITILLTAKNEMGSVLNKASKGPFIVGERGAELFIPLRKRESKEAMEPRKIVLEHSGPVIETPIMHTEPEPKPDPEPDSEPSEQPQPNEVTVTTHVKPAETELAESEKPEKE